MGRNLMIYLMSYELCLMSYLMSYVILSPYDLTTLVYVLLLGLRLTISRLVSMHFVLCRSLRILEDMSFLRILIQLEEPPHLTADPIEFRSSIDFSRRRLNDFAVELKDFSPAAEQTLGLRRGPSPLMFGQTRPDVWLSSKVILIAFVRVQVEMKGFFCNLFD